MQESPVFSRTYDLLLWLIPQVTKFPRAHRFGVGERATRLSLSLQETLTAAGLSSGPERARYLKEADVQLAQLRQHLRLCADLGCLSIAQYEHASRMMAEVGRLLGGWQKSERTTGSAKGGAGGSGRLVEQQS